MESSRTTIPSDSEDDISLQKQRKKMTDMGEKDDKKKPTEKGRKKSISPKEFLVRNYEKAGK